MTESTRVALYARFSCDKQRDASIEDQLEACTEYCAKHEGYTVVATYCDYAISGRSDDRPQFLKMVNDAQEGAFDVIVLWKLDRFARNMEDQYYYEHILSKAGVHLESVKEDICGKGIEATSVKALTALFAQIRSQQSADDVMRGMLGKARKCQYLGVVKLGYSHDGDTITLDETWAPVVREAHALYLQGNSIKYICSWMASKGATTTTGATPGFNFVRNMLADEWYAGVYRWGVEKDRHGKPVLDAFGNKVPLVRVEGGIPAIVAPDEKRACRQRLGIRRRLVQEMTYPLTGKLICNKCGHPLHGSSATSHTGTTHYYYSCKDKCRTCYGPLRKDMVEQRIATSIRSLLHNKALCEDIAERHIQWQAANRPDDAYIKSAQSELRAIERQRNNILDAIAEGMQYAVAKPKLETLDANQELVERRLAEAKTYTATTDKATILNFLQAISADTLSDDEVLDLFVATARLYDGQVAIAMNFTHAPIAPHELTYALGLGNKKAEPPAEGSTNFSLVDQPLFSTNLYSITRLALLRSGIGVLLPLDAA